MCSGPSPPASPSISQPSPPITHTWPKGGRRAPLRTFSWRWLAPQREWRTSRAGQTRNKERRSGERATWFPGRDPNRYQADVPQPVPCRSSGLCRPNQGLRWHGQLRDCATFCGSLCFCGGSPNSRGMTAFGRGPGTSTCRNQVLKSYWFRRRLGVHSLRQRLTEIRIQLNGGL